MKQVNEKDWKLFRSRPPGWQEAYMGKLIEEYKALLNSEGQASERFCALEKRVKQDRRNPGVLLHQKSFMRKHGGFFRLCHRFLSPRFVRGIAFFGLLWYHRLIFISYFILYHLERT